MSVSVFGSSARTNQFLGSGNGVEANGTGSPNKLRMDWRTSGSMSAETLGIHRSVVEATALAVGVVGVLDVGVVSGRSTVVLVKSLSRLGVLLKIVNRIS